MRHVIEKLNDEATKYTANRFFTKRDEISLQMQTALNQTLALECYADIRGFQLTDTDLPQKFEDAITETQVQDSQIITAQNQKVSVKVDLESMESNAGIAVSVTLNNAQAKAEAEMERNKAAMNSFENIIVSQANAYSALK